jgi:hypothetical protein
LGRQISDLPVIVFRNAGISGKAGTDPSRGTPGIGTCQRLPPVRRMTPNLPFGSAILHSALSTTDLALSLTKSSAPFATRRLEAPTWDAADRPATAPSSRSGTSGAGEPAGPGLCAGLLRGKHNRNPHHP